MFKKNNTKSKSRNSGLKSKGDRLGWVSLKDAQSVKLHKALSKREVVRVKRDQAALLVP